MKQKLKSKILVAVLGLVFAFSPSFTNLTNASITTLSITTNQNNIISSKVPAINFTGGVTGVTSSVPVVTFAGGGNALTSSIPTINFSGGAEGLATFPDITFSGGVDERKAEITLIVQSLPAAGTYIDIGICRVNFVDTIDDNDSLDCHGGQATISRTTATGGVGTLRTPEQIAALIGNLNDLSSPIMDSVHGQISSDVTGNSIRFLTVGIEYDAGYINFAETTSGAIFAQNSIASIAGVRAVSAITITESLIANAPDHLIRIDGIFIDFGTSAMSTDQIAFKVKDVLFKDGLYPGKDYTVWNSGSDIVFTKKTTGVIENGTYLAVSDDDYNKANPTAASTTITIPDGLAVNASDHSITIDGVVIDLGTSAKTADQIAAQIAATNFTAGTNYATGGYTVTNPSGSIINFTKNTAGAAGNGSITIADANYTTTNAVAASSTITIPAGLAANATDHSITIDGVVIDLGTSAKTADQIAAQIAATNFTAGTNYATGGYTVTNPSGAIVTFTKNTAGAAGNGSITIADANYGATSQVVIVTPSNITPGETAVLVINGVSYSYVIQSGDTAISVVNGLKNAITESNLTKTGTDTLILTSRIAGTAFSISDNSQAAPPAVVVKKKSSKDKKDEKKKSRDIKNKSSIKRGAVLVQSGKRFSKNSPVLLYFSKPGGGYYPPTKIQTSKSGTFSINYRVTKPVGKYSWYAIDSKTGKKSKTVTYTVK